MASTRVRLRPGPAATRWLTGRIRELQAGDPLHPVSVVVPGNHAGLHLRRHLAGEGYANVRFTTLDRLAEALGSRRLAAAGATPLQSVTRAALVRAALRGSGAPLAEVADDAGLVDLVARLAAELRRRGDPDGDTARIRAAGTATSRAVLGAVGAYEALRSRARLYDEVDLRTAATAALGEGGVEAAVAGLGDVVVLLPEHLDPADTALLDALAERTTVTLAVADLDGGAAPAPGLGAVEVVIAPDPVEEVRGAVRGALAAAEAGAAPLHRTAIVYRDADTYAGLLRDALDEAGVAQVALDGRPLSESAAGRGLLGLVRLRDERFDRAAVLSWLSTMPGGDGVLAGQARWDKLSRDAGVVREAAQWCSLLLGYAGRCRAAARAAENVEEDAVEARRGGLLRDAADAERIAEHVAAIDTATVAPEERTWEAFVAWALRLRSEFITPGRGWTAEDREALQAVDEAVGGLLAAHAVEPQVSVRTFLRSLEDALRGRRRPAGRIGMGVITGPHQLLAGMDVDRVQVLGAVEGAFPAPTAVDPLLPGDPLDRRSRHEADERRRWLTALAVADGGTAVVSAPAADLEGRAAFPSPWLLECLATEGTAHPRASDVRSCAVVHPRLAHTRSVEAGLATPTPLSLAERREAEALGMRRQLGTPLAGALVLRDDLPLARALEATRARRSQELTAFDGDVSDAAGEDLVGRGLAGRAQSATGVETWATCPFRHLLGRVLGVSATEDAEDDRWWRIDAAERGSLIHGILQTFFDDVREHDDPPPGSPYLDAHVRRLEEIARAAFADAQTRGITGHRLVWAIEQTSILADLRTLLVQDAEQRETGWRPAFLEQPFGFDGDARSWPAVEVPLEGGRMLRLRGYVDRVDLDGRGGARVIDYKTGKEVDAAVGAAARFDAGRRLQLPVYGRAVRDHLRRTGVEPGATTALYWYATLRGGFKQKSLGVDAEVEETLTAVLSAIDAGVRAGCFPQVPGAMSEYRGKCENCTYCEYDTLCPAGRDVLAASKAESPRLDPWRALQPPDEEEGE